MRCMKCMSEYDDKFDMCPFCGTESDAKQKELYFLPVGTMILDRYMVGLTCGSGGFGITYRAWDTALSKIVAIKEYYPVGLVNRVPGDSRVIVYSGNRGKEFYKGKERFMDEARNMAQFNTNANIVNVYDFFEANQTAYIVMEYLDGITFKEYLKGIDGPAPIDYSLEVITAVLKALTEVHKSGILHRDISPDNVFLCKDGKIKLIDFGAARFSSTEEEHTYSIILKPGFAPPEQYQSKSKQGPWTDIYAVGAMLFRALTGIVPDESVNRTEEDNLPDPNKLNSEISVNLNNCILRAMALQPELRFRDSREFLAAINSSSTVKDVRRELKRRKKRRIITIVLASTLAIIGGVICLSIMNGRKKDAAILDAATISMWVPLSEKFDEQEVKDAYDMALNEFRTNYPQVTVNLTFIPEKEYKSRIIEAQAQGKLPTLFNSDGITSEELPSTIDMSEVLKYVETDDYFYIKDFGEIYGSNNKFPISFTVPTVYLNNLAAGTDSKAEEFISSGNYLTTEDEDSLQKFLDAESPCLLGDITDYDVIQSEIAGIYRVAILPDLGDVTLHDSYSISSAASDREQEAATQVVVFLLTETAQDYIYIQNDDKLPVNKKIFSVFVGINKEFSEMEDRIKKLNVIGE